ncbi:MAG: hypothetical protein WCF65_09055, partial [Parachlamydiaceae bacterium]
MHEVLTVYQSKNSQQQDRAVNQLLQDPKKTAEVNAWIQNHSDTIPHCPMIQDLKDRLMRRLSV